MGRLISMVFVFGVLLFQAYSVEAVGIEDLTKVVNERSQRASSSAIDWATSNADARPIEPGATLVLADLKGPGEIRHLWFTIAAQDQYFPASLVFRVYYDGLDQPGVESPLGDFFGVGHGALKAYQSLPVEISADGKAYNSFWRMPFKKSAKLTITNESDKPVLAFYSYVDWVELPSFPPDKAYFHAQYHQEKPPQPGKNVLILDTKGKGHYVGTVLSVHLSEGSWFGEGDDFFYIDGEKEPSLKGTGTEDYFCDAWGFREFTHLRHGVTLWDGYEPGDRGTFYRWHINDPIRFSKSLRVEIEHRGAHLDEAGRIVDGFAERFDDFATVAFWYQTGVPTRFATLPPLSQRLRKIIKLEAEDVKDSITLSTGQAAIQEGPMWSNGKQLFFTPTVGDATLSFPFTVPEGKRFSLRMRLTKSFDYGIYEVSLDGQVPFATYNLYDPIGQTATFSVKNKILPAGNHVLTFVGKGSDSQSKLHGSDTPGYYLGIDGIELTEIPDGQPIVE